MIDRNYKMQIIDNSGKVIKSCTVEHFLGKVNLDTGYRKEMKEFFDWKSEDAIKIIESKVETLKARAIAELAKKAPSAGTVTKAS